MQNLTALKIYIPNFTLRTVKANDLLYQPKARSISLYISYQQKCIKNIKITPHNRPTEMYMLKKTELRQYKIKTRHLKKYHKGENERLENAKLKK